MMYLAQLAGAQAVLGTLKDHCTCSTPSISTQWPKLVPAPTHTPSLPAKSPGQGRKEGTALPFATPGWGQVFIGLCVFPVRAREWWRDGQDSLSF